MNRGFLISCPRSSLPSQRRRLLPSPSGSDGEARLRGGGLDLTPCDLAVPARQAAVATPILCGGLSASQIRPALPVHRGQTKKTDHGAFEEDGKQKGGRMISQVRQGHLAYFLRVKKRKEMGQAQEEGVCGGRIGCVRQHIVRVTYKKVGVCYGQMTMLPFIRFVRGGVYRRCIVLPVNLYNISDIFAKQKLN
uniref:Uncharacterized protein n=1 Tax=Triticum urartu TaxID=4572 RepID=A0A8R7V435_TRIUA